MAGSTFSFDANGVIGGETHLEPSVLRLLPGGFLLGVGGRERLLQLGLGAALNHSIPFGVEGICLDKNL